MADDDHTDTRDFGWKDLFYLVLSSVVYHFTAIQAGFAFSWMAKRYGSALTLMEPVDTCLVGFALLAFGVTFLFAFYRGTYSLTWAFRWLYRRLEFAEGEFGDPM